MAPDVAVVEAVIEREEEDRHVFDVALGAEKVPFRPRGAGRARAVMRSAGVRLPGNCEWDWPAPAVRHGKYAKRRGPWLVTRILQHAVCAECPAAGKVPAQ